MPLIIPCILHPVYLVYTIRYTAYNMHGNTLYTIIWCIPYSVYCIVYTLNYTAWVYIKLMLHFIVDYKFIL